MGEQTEGAPKAEETEDAPQAEKTGDAPKAAEQGPDTGLRGWWRTRWEKLKTAERGALAGVAREVRERGPLHAAHLIAGGQLGGPITRFAFRHLLGARAFGQPVPFFLTAVFGPPLFGLLALIATDIVLSGGSTVVQVLFVAVLVVLAAVACVLTYLLALRPTRDRMLSVVRRWSREDLAWWGEMVVVVPMVAFAAVTAWLVRRKLIGFEGVEASEWGLSFKTLEVFAWSLADAVPILNAPETLMWTPQLKLTTMTGGALVLAYKLVLILPLVQLVAIALARSFGDARPGRPDG